MTTMNTTIKVWVKTRRTLQLIAALTDERMVAVIARLAIVELAHLQADQRKEQNETNPIEQPKE